MSCFTLHMQYGLGIHFQLAQQEPQLHHPHQSHQGNRHQVGTQRHRPVHLHQVHQFQQITGVGHFKQINKQPSNVANYLKQHHQNLNHCRIGICFIPLDPLFDSMVYQLPIRFNNVCQNALKEEQSYILLQPYRQTFLCLCSQHNNLSPT